jgi:hypothetical protein
VLAAGAALWPEFSWAVERASGRGYLLAQQPGQQDPWSVTIASLFSLVTRARRESHAVLMNV